MINQLKLKSLMSNGFVRFLFVGGLATAINYFSRFGWSHFLPFSVAVPAAYITGMLFSFTMYRQFVFPRSPVPVHRQIAGFILINMLGITQVWLISMGLTKYVFPLTGLDLFYSQALSHGIAILVPILSSYIGHKHLTFRGAQ